MLDCTNINIIKTPTAIYYIIKGNNSNLSLVNADIAQQVEQLICEKLQLYKETYIENSANSMKAKCL